MKAGQLLLATLFAVCAAPAGVAAQDLQTVLAFESGTLDGWLGGPPATLSLDSTVAMQGRYAGRIDRPAGQVEDGFSSLTHRVRRDFAGDRIVLRGWIRTEEVDGYAGLWMRQDGSSGMVQFDNMAGRGPSGTTGWTEYSIDLPLDDRTRWVYFGVLLSGDGTAWADDLDLTVDGVPPAEAPVFVRSQPAFGQDTEFDDGSRIAAFEPTAERVERLALLGRVWGFVKYHHPRVRAGQVHWDYELFRVLPGVIGAVDRAAALAAMSVWLDDLGEPEPCAPCARPAVGAQLDPEIDWIRDRSLLGDALSGRLVTIHDRRPAGAEHFYVSQAQGVGNPLFEDENPYSQWSLPDVGYRILALYRYWNIIEYWFPYRDLIPGEWDSTLAEFVPRVLEADTAEAYRVTMMQLIARIRDTHANLWSHMGVQPPVGPARIPVVVRFVDGRAVVTAYTHPELGPATGLRVGDVIEELDGLEVTSLVEQWRPFYAASNEPTRLRDIARNLTRGEPGAVRVSGRRADGAFTVTTERVTQSRLDRAAGSTHDLAGPTFQRLSDEVAYLKLSSVVTADIPEYLAGAEGADVLVVDIRNYPAEFVVFSLGGHLLSEPAQHARFSVVDGANPGAFQLTPPFTIQPLEPYFPGRVAILLDEVSQSQAEYTAMALRAGPNAIVVGSTTAGADGNVSQIPLPGGLGTMISGIGVFYADGTPTQRVGIVPDLEVRPTLEGIRAGRDEVLEAAVSELLGREWRLPSGR